MFHDQAMAEEWIIRVDGKEYGPADLETVREWKADGRVLPENEARLADSDQWITAREIPDLFRLTTLPPIQVEPAQPRAHQSFLQIIGRTFRIYRQRFLQFFCLALMVILPSACGQLASSLFETTPNLNVDLRTVVAGAFSFCMIVLAMVLWPIYIAAIQILSAETLRGGRPGFFATLNEAVKYWPRVAALCIFVYGVFILILSFGLGITLMAVAGATSLPVIFFALALLGLQVWMFGRFFINVLFWQQFAVLEGANVLDSLRESKILARGESALPWFRRPWWRGALIVSIWTAFVLAITLGPEWSTMRHYFDEIATTTDPQILLQKLNAAAPAHGFDLQSFGLSVLQKILQPLLGIAFVVLYFDSKGESEL
jgi:hypothetical protein